MLTLRGAPVLSDFAATSWRKTDPDPPRDQLLHTEYVHFAELRAPLAAPEQAVLENLLEYGPGFSGSATADLDSATLRLVVPRPGTISPWSARPPI